MLPWLKSGWKNDVVDEAENWDEERKLERSFEKLKGNGKRDL